MKKIRMNPILFSALVPALMSLMLLSFAGCSLDDGDDMSQELWQDMALAQGYGEFNGRWLIGGRLASEAVLSIGSAPKGASSQAASVAYGEAVLTSFPLASLLVETVGDMALRQAPALAFSSMLKGYSDAALYYDLTVGPCQYEIEVGGRQLSAQVTFASDRSVAIYDYDIDHWTLTFYVDSVVLADQESGETVWQTSGKEQKLTFTSTLRK
ncbi:MAG: hypothetical protein IJ196_07000 [Prevotella sp.]|nr:hypothetical protein [Prevotella sp.]